MFRSRVVGRSDGCLVALKIFTSCVVLCDRSLQLFRHVALVVEAVSTKVMYTQAITGMYRVLGQLFDALSRIMVRFFMVSVSLIWGCAKLLQL